MGGAGTAERSPLWRHRENTRRRRPQGESGRQGTTSPLLAEGWFISRRLCHAARLNHGDEGSQRATSCSVSNTSLRALFYHILRARERDLRQGFHFPGISLHMHTRLVSAILAGVSTAAMGTTSQPRSRQGAASSRRPGHASRRWSNAPPGHGSIGRESTSVTNLTGSASWIPRRGPLFSAVVFDAHNERGRQNLAGARLQ